MKAFWGKIWRPLLTLGTFLGWLMGVVSFFGWWTPGDNQYVLWKIDEKPIVTRSNNFAPTISIGNFKAENENVFEVEVTFWRDGGRPITAEMVRRPLSIQLPSGSQVLAQKVIGENSSLKDNFAVSADKNQIQVNWKVFDPDMALKVAFIRQGAREAISITETLGPDALTTDKRYSWAKILFIIVLIAASFFAILVSMFTVFFPLIENAIESTAIFHKYVRFIPIIIVACCGFALCIALIAGMIWLNNWIASAIVVPVPFR